MKALFALAVLTCSFPLLAMDMDNPNIENRQVSWVSQSRVKGDIMPELITFISRTTRKEYALNMRHDWALKDYIRQLKRDGILSKAEGAYNYNAQYFFIQNKCYSGDTLLSHQDVCLLASEKKLIEFKFQ